MLGRAQNGETLTITKIVVGDGAASQPSDLWPLTNLIAQKKVVTLSTKNDFGDGTLLVEGSFNSDDVPSAFYLKEVGVMAHIGAEADRLYSVANVFSDPPDYVDPAAPTIQAFKIKLVIDRIPAVNLVVSISPSENVLGENLGADTVGPGWYASAAGNILKFKRIEAGPGIECIEDAGHTKVTVRTKELQTNVDLYVPESYPGAPVGARFPTIQAAHDYLLAFRIPADKLATIHVWSGALTIDPPGTILYHPDAKQISIIGQPRIDKPCSRVNYINPTRKDAIVSNNTGLSINLPVWLAYCGGGFSGGALITSIAGTTIGLNVFKQDSRPTYTLNDTASSGVRRLSYLPTILVFNGTPTSGQNVLTCPNGIRSIENICCYNGWHGIAIGGTGGTVRNCMVMSVSHVCLSISGHVNLVDENVFCNGGTFGITGDGVLSAPYQTYISACGQGIGLDQSGVGCYEVPLQPLNGIVYFNHNVYGCNARGSTIAIGSIVFTNNDYAFNSEKGGAQILNGGGIGGIPYNNGIDCRAAGMSYIEYGIDDNLTGVPPPTCNPTAETNGNQNSFIHLFHFVGDAAPGGGVGAAPLEDEVNPQAVLRFNAAQFAAA